MLQSIQPFTFFKLPKHQHTPSGNKMKAEGNSTRSLKAASSSAAPPPNPTSTNYVYQVQDRVFFSHRITTHLSMKSQGEFVLLCHSQISQTTACLMVRSWYLWKAIEWVGLHPLGLRLFGAMVWKLLIIESFFQWRLNKFQTQNCIGILRCSWYCWKVIRFNRVYFTIFKAQVCKILIF